MENIILVTNYTLKQSANYLLWIGLLNSYLLVKALATRKFLMCHGSVSRIELVNFLAYFTMSSGNMIPGSYLTTNKKYITTTWRPARSPDQKDSDKSSQTIHQDGKEFCLKSIAFYNKILQGNQQICEDDQNYCAKNTVDSQAAAFIHSDGDQDRHAIINMTQCRGHHQCT
jgi:hypothetical protein